MGWRRDLEPGPLVAVNSPAFELWGFDSLSTAGTPALHMRAVVGKAMDAHTPIFLDYMEYVVFDPYWSLPYSILEGELLPALQRDPQALERRGMEIVRGSDPTTALPVTPENIVSPRAGTLEVRERIVAAMEGTTPQRVNLKRHLPVILFYSTAMVARDGRVFFYDDVYGNDARLERELQNEYSYQP